MKKIFCILLICLLFLCACSKEKFESSSITVKKIKNNEIITLIEDTDEVLNILNNNEWIKGEYKVRYDMIFEMDDGSLVYYCSDTFLFLLKKIQLSEQ